MAGALQSIPDTPMQGPKQMKKCRDVMTGDPVFCIPTDPASMAARLMRDHDVGSIPVAEDRKTKRIVGILTDRDLALSLVAEERDPSGTTVGDLMTPNPFTCRPDDDLDKAIQAMERHQIRRVPVVDAEHRLAGMIAQADIAVHSDERTKTAELLEEVSKPA
jgi:CBS domain-containing protein